MIELPSQLEGQHFDLYKLEQILKPMGYSIGGNWDYDHGAFDYKMSERDGYLYLRLPFRAVDGQLDSRNCTVELGRPYLLNHVYQEGLDDHAHVDNGSALFNQFQEPVDEDGEIPANIQEVGKTIVQNLETILK
ncbi:YugN-like family protein [Bacillus marasmi]|uniref:YugN-like family protein n=1 Tax=Bacillus marasmi TaxID=1926279 RepID=UPI0011C95ADC|nr:YugN-like family protein [Bacillus marasmi]